MTEVDRTGTEGTGRIGLQYPRKYAQDTWFALVWAAETEQGCDEFEALSTERGCSGSGFGG